MKFILNQALIAKQGLTLSEVLTIEELHKTKQLLIWRMKHSKKPETLRRLADEVTEVEYKLQDAWKFPRDKNFHKFWELPGCSCPLHDNCERWGTGYAVYSQDCLIHGWEQK